MQIHVIGTGDAYASERANSSVLVEQQSFKLLIDCGPTACHQLWKSPLWPTLDAVYFTHLHPDHALGLTSLINRFNSSSRRKKLQIYCHRGKEHRLKQLVEYGFWSDRKNYPVEFILLDSQSPEDTFKIGPLTCQSQETYHGVTNHSLSFATQNYRVFYSGDGAITDAGAALMKGCDLAFVECQAMSLPQGAGHSDFNNITKLAQAMPETQMMLYHIGDSELEPMTQAAANFENMRVAQQGEVINLRELLQKEGI